LGDAALNEALRLRPDRSEAHLAVGLRTLARVVDRAQQNLWADGDSLALCFSHAVDSVLKDFLQEIGKRGPPNKHAMSSWDDDIDMLDVQRS
jgi:hypothetical protein